MIDPHLFLCNDGESVPARWEQAFPQGMTVDESALHGRLRSHSLSHGQIWLLASPQQDWLGRVGRMQTLQPGLKIVLLSGVPTEDEGLQAVQAGVRGYAHSHAVPALLQEVALVVHHGGLWLGPDLMRRMVQATAGALRRSVAPQSALRVTDDGLLRGRKPRATHGPSSEAPPSTPDAGSPDAAWVGLTVREQQIAQSVTQGRSNKEIALQMRIAEKTVKAHLGAVFQKLGVRDRLQLVVKMATVTAPVPPKRHARKSTRKAKP